jgi:hypothetical protein
LAEKELFEKNNINSMRRRAKVVGPRQKKIFQIDISKFECCEEKEKTELDGYTIYVYTPRLIVFEKVRAICQQMPEYSKIIKANTFSARAYDFYDIYIVMENFPLDLNIDENKQLLRKVFDSKKVPIEWLKRIHLYKEYHREGYLSLKDTLKSGTDLKSFDFYFDYVVEKFGSLRFKNY